MDGRVFTVQIEGEGGSHAKNELYGGLFLMTRNAANVKYDKVVGSVDELRDVTINCNKA